MRVKRDYMGNDRLLPAYNMQTAICNGYIVVTDVQQAPDKALVLVRCFFGDCFFTSPLAMYKNSTDDEGL